MRGVLFAVGEIVVLMAVATAIGAAIGALVVSLRRDRLRKKEADDHAAAIRNARVNAEELKHRLEVTETVVRELEDERVAAAAAKDEVAALRVELARLRVQAADVDRLQVEVDDRDRRIFTLESVGRRRPPSPEPRPVGGEETTVRTIVGNGAEATVIFDLRDRERERA